MQGDKPRCAIYCRVARDDDEAPGAAIERQRQTILAYAREMGYTCTAEYLDNGYSGLDMNRPGLQSLNNDIAAGRASVVIMKDPSRIARDSVQCSNWFSRMDKQGVTVFCSDVPEYAALSKEFTQLQGTMVMAYKKGRKEQKRHTLRTPPPSSKSR